MFTNTFKKLNENEMLKGRVEEKEIRKEHIGEYTVVQYRIFIVDSNRTLQYAVKITSNKEDIELPPTSYAFNSQWLYAKEYAYDIIPSG